MRGSPIPRPARFCPGRCSPAAAVGGAAAPTVAWATPACPGCPQAPSSPYGAGERHWTLHKRGSCRKSVSCPCAGAAGPLSREEAVPLAAEPRAGLWQCCGAQQGLNTPALRGRLGRLRGALAGSKLAVQLAVMVKTCSFSCRAWIKGSWGGDRKSVV